MAYIVHTGVVGVANRRIDARAHAAVRNPEVTSGEAIWST